MEPFPNLISESLLINSTIDYLKARGGKAAADKVVGSVMNIRKPEIGLAKLLMADLINRDPRLMLENDTVEYIDRNHAGIVLENASFVVFDLETTGAKAPPCRITEIGACLVQNGQIVKEFNSLVNPEMPISQFITALTGINDKMVKDAPKFADVAADFMEFVGDAVLVAHNARFDIGFLNHEIGRMFEDYRVGNPSLCTVNLSRRLLSDIENHKLKTVANYYSIDLFNHHRAGDDARATAQIFINFLRDMQSRGILDYDAARKFSAKKLHLC